MIIAEIGTSHGGSIEKAKQLLDACKKAGADAVKFQWVYADEILHPNTGFVKLPGGNVPLYDRFKQLEVQPAFFKQCLQYAHAQKMMFICSPFGLHSLEELMRLHPDAVKIASPEINHYPMLRRLAECRKNQARSGEGIVPVLISSGVSKLGDIEAALDIIGKDRVTLLHCVTCYPAPETEYNVSLIDSLRRIFGIPVGISDHSLDPVLIPCLASAFGASAIEKHITLSHNTDGLDDTVALDPEQFSHMVYCVHQCEAALGRYTAENGQKRIKKELSEQYGTQKIADIIGDGTKHLAKSERLNYGRTNRSLHFMRNMKKGDVIAESDIAVLRTEKVLSPGISPAYIDDLTGAKLFHNVTSGEGVQWDDIIHKE